MGRSAINEGHRFLLEVSVHGELLDPDGFHSTESLEESRSLIQEISSCIPPSRRRWSALS